MEFFLNVPFTKISLRNSDEHILKLWAFNEAGNAFWNSTSIVSSIKMSSDLYGKIKPSQNPNEYKIILNEKTGDFCV